MKVTCRSRLKATSDTLRYDSYDSYPFSSICVMNDVAFSSHAESGPFIPLHSTLFLLLSTILIQLHLIAFCAVLEKMNLIPRHLITLSNLPDDIRMLIVSNLPLSDAFNLNLALPHPSHSAAIRRRICKLRPLRDAWIHAEQSALPSYANPPHLATPSARHSLSPLDFTSLTTLTLRRTHLTTLPAIEELNQLRVIDASYNHLTNLPPSITSCTKLRVLNLGHNQLHRFPTIVMNLPHLCTLLLHNNPITSLPTNCWSDLVHLYRLGLFECQLSGVLPDQLCKLLSTPTRRGRQRSANLQRNNFDPDLLANVFNIFPLLSSVILI